VVRSFALFGIAKAAIDNIIVLLYRHSNSMIRQINRKMSASKLDGIVARRGPAARDVLRSEAVGRMGLAKVGVR